MKNENLLASCSVLIGCLVGGFANANDQSCQQQQESNYKQCDNQIGWYVGGDLGYAKTSIKRSALDNFYQQSGLIAQSVDIDDSDNSFSVFGGYQFSSYLALEAGYLDLGNRAVSFTGETADLDSFYDNAEHIYPQAGNGYTVAIVGSYPIAQSWKLSAKVGYFDWEADYQTTALGDKVGEDHISGGDIWFGAEVNYRVSDSLQMYVSAQRYKLARDKTTNLAVGLRYFFGESSANKIPPPPKRVAKPAKVIVPADGDRDGIIDANDKCPGSDVKYRVDTVGCVMMQEQPFSFSLVVYFANDSSTIPSQYDDKLSALASFIAKHQVTNLKVYGHTSASGTATYNLWLSQRRAQAVSDTLVAKFNISQGVIEPIGRGETELIDSDNSSAADDKNRRIELHIQERLMLPIAK